MNYIENLLQGQKVEWKTLGEVCELQRGKSITSKDLKDGNIPVIAGGQKPAYFHNEHNREGETIVVAGSGAYAGFVSYWNEPIFVSDAFSIKPNNEELFCKYVFHFLKDKQESLYGMKKGGGVPHVYAKDVAKIKIPLPPLAVQKEIANILDTFTTLEAELEAELDCRKRQYHHYRDTLLTFGNEVEWKTLGEVAVKISSGGTPKTGVAEYYNGEIPWLRTQEVGYGEIWDTGIKITEEGMKNSSAKWIPKNCIIVAMYGATVGRIGINKIPLTTNQACANIEIDENVAYYKYVYYCLLNQYEYIKSLGTGSQTNINAQIVKKIKIPLPSLEEQKRIVNILDKFDTLTNSITEGLPKEIELRRKQYEYYREKLLSFNKD